VPKKSTVSFSKIVRPPPSRDAENAIKNVVKPDSKVTKLVTDVRYVQGDISEMKSDVRDIKKDARRNFRLLFGVNLTTTPGLAALMVKVFHWI